MLKAVLLFLLGLILLIKGGDWFVDGACGLAKRFHIPELIIGATIVSIGTTLPEVMVSSTAALMGKGSIAYGNAIGSIICNTALILALTITVSPSAVDRESLKLPSLFFLGAAAVYFVISYTTGRFSRLCGILLLVMFAFYMFLTLRQARKTVPIPQDRSAEHETEEDEASPLWKELLFLVLGAALIAFGADLLVDNGTLIAKALGVPDSVIGLTFVALGTSLPELVTAITSLVKGRNALSLGNIIGANLFNLILVSGVSTVLCPYTIPAEKTIGSVNAALIVDLPLMLLVMLIVLIPAFKNGKLGRKQGIPLLALYAAFCAFQFFF